MISQRALAPTKSTIQQKAIQKYPFTLNNETYFASECYFQNTIINGISLQLKQAKGISNQQQTISYLSYSNRLVFYAGANILSYNTYKRNYQIVNESQNLLCLKAYSLSTAQKEYIVWIQKKQRNSHEIDIQNQNTKFVYHICIHNLTRKEKIIDEKFVSLNQDINAQNVQVIVFMHPFKIIGIIIYDDQRNQTQIIYKKMFKPNQQTEFGDQCKLVFPYQFKFLKYDLESNAYFFMKSQYEIGALRCILENNEDSLYGSRKQQGNLQVQKLIALNEKKNAVPRKIIHFALSQAYLLILTCSQCGSQRNFQFYSLFSYDLIFSQIIWKIGEKADLIHRKRSILQNELEQQSQQILPIDYIQFNKSVIIGMRGNTTEISIFSLYEQNLRHIRNTILDLDNCFKIARLFINPFSSQVLILSRHYELEGTITTAHRSTKVIKKSETRYKSFFIQVSSFFITMEASIINVQKLSLQKKNYSNILTAPWLSQFLIQTENSLKSKRWQQKFDAVIKCSTVHPTGQYVALGFNDCFKIYFLTYEGLVHTFVTENLKQCTSLCYSKTGNDFAAATCFNIYIYDCYSYLKKHQISLGMSYRIEEIVYVDGYENNRVKQCLQCLTNNKRLVIYNVQQDYRQQFSFNPKSHLQNGILQNIISMVSTRMNKLNQTDLFGFCMESKYPASNYGTSSSRSNQANNLANKKFGAIIYDEKTKIVIFSMGLKLYFINTQNFESLGCFDFDEVSCIQLCRSLNTMFFGTTNGKIIAFPWPNKPINITSKIPTFSVHTTRIKKIKISSNLFQLISITDQSMYIHSLTLIHQMRKIQKYQLQRQRNPQSVVALDFYLRMGFCLFTAEKYEQKCEGIKQNEEEAVNFNFILPQERQKQKNVMLGKLESQKDKISMQSQEEGMPLKMQALNIKQKVRCITKQIDNNYNSYINTTQKEIEDYQTKLSQLCVQKDDLRARLSCIEKQLNTEKLKIQQQLKKQQIRSDALYRLKLDEVNKKTQDADGKRIKAINNFCELTEMDEQKKIHNQQVIRGIENQINDLMQRNGFLMCRNTNLEKDISTKKRKIDDIKDLIVNTQRNIDNLPKRSKVTPKLEDIKQQAHINKQFAETQKRYLKQTKKLIQKNKAINVSIELYERQRQMLVILEKQLEQQQGNIDDILDYIMKQRNYKKAIKEKVNNVSEKVQQVAKTYQLVNQRRIKSRNQLKGYLYSLSMFEEGVLGIDKLKKISHIDSKDMVNPPENIQMSIQEKKRKISKILSTEEKILNVMKNQRKIYSNQKRKTGMHNQDLLVNFNFLLHDSKHLINVMNDQKSKRKYCLKNMNNKKENRRLITKPTPFQTYINFRTTRRLKTTPCAQFDLSN